MAAQLSDVLLNVTFFVDASLEKVVHYRCKFAVQFSY